MNIVLSQLNNHNYFSKFSFIVDEIIRKIDDCSVDDLKTIDELMKQNKAKQSEPLDKTSPSNYLFSHIKRLMSTLELSYFQLLLDDSILNSDDKIDKYKHLPLSCFDMIEVSWHFF